jgi:hypothetical protein
MSRKRFTPEQIIGKLREVGLSNQFCNLRISAMTRDLSGSQKFKLSAAYRYIKPIIKGASL